MEVFIVKVYRTFLSYLAYQICVFTNVMVFLIQCLFTKHFIEALQAESKTDRPKKLLNKPMVADQRNHIRFLSK